MRPLVGDPLTADNADQLVGPWLDEANHSADGLNLRTIEIAKQYGWRLGDDWENGDFWDWMRLTGHKPDEWCTDAESSLRWPTERFDQAEWDAKVEAIEAKSRRKLDGQFITGLPQWRDDVAALRGDRPGWNAPPLTGCVDPADCQWLSELGDKAVDYLNHEIAPDGYYFRFDGGLIFSKDDDDDDC